MSTIGSSDSDGYRTIVKGSRSGSVVRVERREQQVVQAKTSRVLVEADGAGQQLITSEQQHHLVRADQAESRVVLAGVRGRVGAMGEPGPIGGSALQRVAGTALSALRVVYELDGQVFLLDYLDADHINLALGVTLTAAPQGGALNVQRSGAMDDASWNWTPGLVWLGSNGALTQAPVVTGFRLNVGVAVSPTRLLLNLEYPIDLGV